MLRFELLIGPYGMRGLAVAFLALGCAGCGAAARLPVSAGTGPRPVFPPEDRSLIPIVHVVTARGWAPGAKPVPAEGTSVTAFARGLEHPLALRASQRRRAGG